MNNINTDYNLINPRSTTATITLNDRTVRKVGPVQTQTTNWLGNLNLLYLPKQFHILNQSILHDIVPTTSSRFTQTSTIAPLSFNPINSTSSIYKPNGFDRFRLGHVDDTVTPTMMNNKEEGAPNFVFDTYWSTY